MRYFVSALHLESMLAKGQNEGGVACTNAFTRTKRRRIIFVWVFGFTLLGYFLGSNDFVKEYKEVGVLAVILISFLPVFFEFIKVKFKKH